MNDGQSTSQTPIADSLRDHGSKYYNHPRYDAKLIKAIERLEMENAELRKSYSRYEKLRKLNPREFAELFRSNLIGLNNFDDLVDLLP